MSFFNRIVKNKSVLGVDVGTANIKIAQISHGDKMTLETYGMVNTHYQLGGKNDDASIEPMANILKSLLEKAGVTAKKCVISFPNYAVFTSVIEVPTMSEKELGTAVEFEAKKYVPLALEDIDLSWTVIANPEKKNTTQVLLTAVPKQITKNYMAVFEKAGLEPEVGEIEALAMIRSLIGNQPINCVIIDIGGKSTGLNIIEHGFLRLSRNLNVGGDTITNKIAESLNISPRRAEQFKQDFGVSNSTFLPEVVKPVLNTIRSEVKQLLAIYQTQETRLDKIILVGGGSHMPGLVEFFEDLGLSVELGDPLKTIAYSQNLAPILKRYSSNLAIAIGLALRAD